MSKLKTRNNLKLLVNKIAVNANNMDMVKDIVKELSIVCRCHVKSVQRWMNNKSQPSSTDINRIVLCLNKYDSSISFNDYFGTNETNQLRINRSKSANLV